MFLVQRSMLDGGLHVEDFPVNPSRPVSSSPHLGQGRLTPKSLERLKKADHGIGGPAGLWHFIYRNICLDYGMAEMEHIKHKNENYVILCWSFELYAAVKKCQSGAAYNIKLDV